LWAISLFAFTASVLVLEWSKAPPVLVWIVTLNMLSIWADIGQIDLSNSGSANLALEPNLPEAITLSCFAVFFLAIGMRGGVLLGHKVFDGFRENSNYSYGVPYSVRRIIVAYAVTLSISVVADKIGELAPGLSQPAYALIQLKFMVIYLLAATVITFRRGYRSLIAILAFEIASGSIGGWAAYKECFFVVLIALASSSKRFSIGQLGGALVSVTVITYISLAWTAVKVEFRSNIKGSDAWTSLSWIADKYFYGDLDFGAASVALLERVGYNKFLAMVLRANTEALTGIYQRALFHVLVPRLLYPDKPTLNDTPETAAALGWQIDDNTSIGLGYVAQAFIDFGFPGLLVPMVALGCVVGIIYVYFLTRSAPFIIRQAFAVASLFNSLAFAGNIDKQLGGLIMTFVVMAGVLHYYAWPLHRWLENRR
jgi:hypothetical protein